MDDHGEINRNAFCIGAFTVEPSQNLLVKDATTYALEPRIMDVLCALALKPREVIPRDILIKNVWNVKYGADESLTRAISVLRKTFRSAGEKQDVIQTIPKRGYRLAMDVTHIGQAITMPEKPTPVAIPKTNTFAHETKNEKKTKNTQPLRMVEADISGYVPVTLEAKTLLRKKKHVLFGLGLFPLLIVIGTIFWFGRNEHIGNTLSIEKYGRSVAVLSLVDMSAKSELEYFADGMAEEILSVLSKIPDLRVVGRSSSFAYKGKNIDIRKIGSTLEVSHIIDGSVRKQGEVLKITIRLNNVSDGSQVWSKSYYGSLENIIHLQEEISQDIIVNLKLLLGISLDQIIDLDF